MPTVRLTLMLVGVLSFVCPGCTCKRFSQENVVRAAESPSEAKSAEHLMGFRDAVIFAKAYGVMGDINWKSETPAEYLRGFYEGMDAAERVFFIGRAQPEHGYDWTVSSEPRF